MSSESERRAAAEARGIHVCAVCGRVLDWHEPLVGEGRWAHTKLDVEETISHPPVPVRFEDAGEQAKPRCDFCSMDYPTFTLPARTFGLDRGYRSVGDWAACDGCAAHIGINDWKGLLRRCMASRAARGQDTDEATAAAYKAVWRSLRKHVSGALYRHEGGGRVE